MARDRVALNGYARILDELGSVVKSEMVVGDRKCLGGGWRCSVCDRETEVPYAQFLAPGATEDAEDAALHGAMRLAQDPEVQAKRPPSGPRRMIRENELLRQELAEKTAELARLKQKHGAESGVNTMASGGD